MSSIGPGSKLPILGQPTPPERAAADGRTWWRRVEEHDRARLPSPEFEEGAAEAPDGVSRRNFLQILGASAALASLDACRPPRHKILPYVRPPEKALLPGQALHYATAVSMGGYATGLLVTIHDGRPTKVEGNPDHPSSLGGVSSFELATLLDLYDPRRARGFKKGQSSLSYRSALTELATLAASHAQDGGARLRFLTAPTASPLLLDLRRRILARFPNARFHTFESVSDEASREGGRIAFGRPLVPRHDLREARVILSLDADFLALGPESLRLARQYAARRAPGAEMNRLYVAEAQLSVTGSSADHRFRMKPSEVLGFGRAVAARLASKHGAAAPGAAGAEAGRFAREAAAVADDLARARGRSVVIAGSQQPPAVHALAHALNAALGNVGKTVEYAPSPVDAGAPTGSLKELATDLAAGKVETLVVTANNPVYASPADVDLTPVIGRAKNAIYLAYRDDETVPRCNWVLAAAHPFETWADARAYDGTISIVQPLIQPLFESLSEVELLAAFVDLADHGAYAILQDFWRQRTGGADFQQKWESYLARGVVPNSATAAESAPLKGDAIVAALRAAPAPSAAGLEVSFVADYKTYDGRFAENAWLQELPHPISKLTWDNAAYVSAATAKKLGVEDGARGELTVGNRKTEVAVWTMPGHADDVITLPLGYGRRRAGPVGTGVGFDAGALRTSAALGFAGGAAFAAAKGKHEFAPTQEHFSMEGRDIALTFAAADWKPASVEHLRRPMETIQPAVDYQGEQYKWGMGIDLSKCIGCSACTTACQAENNIPVVGKEQVARSREMHWLRVDRYFSGSVDDPLAIAQPMMCQHCETAPCEYVCPVNATVHSDEGLNEMIYNRCVGTRYCSNNCPYKVRRFNFLDYRGQMSPTEKMAMNPDVTVRTRGVMEKCTYCVQRIERTRIDARVEGRKIKDGEFTTACAQACPANAIVFGNLNDPESAVSKVHQDERRYDVLHENGTRPRTAYLVRIRNPNPELS